MLELVWVTFAVSVTNVAQFNGAVRCDAFYTNDDQDRHVLVATSSDLWEVFYSYRGIATAHLKSLDNAPNDIAGFYTPNTKSRHALLQDPGGDFFEIVYHPAGPSLELLSLYGDIPLRISSLYNPVTNYWHALLLGQDGTIHNLSWNPKFNFPNYANGASPLGHFGPAVADIGAFFTSDDATKHTIVAGFDGTITEIYWSTNKDEMDQLGDHFSQVVLGPIPGGVNAVAAFFIPGGLYTRRVVAAGPQGVFEFAYDPAIAGVRAAKLLVPESEVLDIGGFYSPDDNVCHAILLLKGDGITQIVQEVYYPA